MIKSRTVRDEIALVDAMTEKNLSPAAVAIVRNSSGMPVMFFNDASGVSVEVKSSENLALDGEIATYGAAVGALQYTSIVSGLSGHTRVLVEVTGDDNSLILFPRWSNKVSPANNQAADWFRELIPNRAVDPVTHLAAGYKVTFAAAGDRFVLEMPVMGSQLSLVFLAHGGPVNNSAISVSVA